MTPQELITLSLSFAPNSEILLGSGTGTNSGISLGNGLKSGLGAGAGTGINGEKGNDVIDWISFLDFFNTHLMVRSILFI